MLEIGFKHLYVVGNHKQIDAHQKKNLGIVLKKFTIPDVKFFSDSNYGKKRRTALAYKINNRKIMQAIPLSLHITGLGNKVK